jgi:hypothetical protein
MPSHKPTVLEKPCRYCGKPILWTRNLAAMWDTVVFCDNACKRRYNRDNPPPVRDEPSYKGPAGGHGTRKRNSAK